MDFSPHSSAELKDKEQVGEALANELQGAARQLHEIYEPQWNVRTDVLKTLVSLSAGSIVLCVTFSSSLRTLSARPLWRYLILFAFVMLITSLIVALIGLWVGAQVYHIQSSMFNTRPEVKQAFVDAKTYDEFFETFQNIQRRSITSIVKRDVSATWLFRASSITFCVAIIALAVVGTRQLLW